YTLSLHTLFRSSIFNNFGELITDNISKIIDDNVYGQKQLLRLIYCKKYPALSKCYANVPINSKDDELDFIANSRDRNKKDQVFELNDEVLERLVVDHGIKKCWKTKKDLEIKNKPQVKQVNKPKIEKTVKKVRKKK